MLYSATGKNKNLINDVKCSEDKRPNEDWGLIINLGRVNKAM